jgi:hypothetical protein
MQRLLESLILTWGALWAFSADASVNRISSVYKDLSKVEKIYLHAGLISLVEFPDPILEVRLGNTKSFKVELSQISPRELTVYLLNSSAAPSNLIVRSNQKIYVFDIIPSNGTHQDYVRIAGSFSLPSFVSGSTVRKETNEVKKTIMAKKPSSVIKIGVN